MERTGQSRTFVGTSDFSRGAFAPIRQKPDASRLRPLQLVAPVEVEIADINQRIDACFPTI